MHDYSENCTNQECPHFLHIHFFGHSLSMKFHLNTKEESVRDMLIAQYDRLGIRKFEREYEVDPRSVRRWKQLKIATGSSAPRYSHIGQPGKLSERELNKLEKALLDNPYATNADLARVVKNKITPQHAGYIIKQSPRGFVQKLEQEDIEASFSQDNFEKGVKFINTNKNVPIKKRVYVDETRISSKVRRRKGRFPKGVAPWTPTNQKYPGHSVIAAIKDHKWLHPGEVYKNGSVTTEEFENYVEDILAPLLEEGDVVYWDRWGRSGRAKNPTAHHFSPTAKASIEAVGAKLKLLPPTGKHCNPIEMLFGEVKKNYDKKLGKKMLKMEPSKISFNAKVKFWHDAEAEIEQKSFDRAYKERANGKEFMRVGSEKCLEINKP